MHVKVMAPTLFARAAARTMAARGSGSIINIAGVLAFSGPAPLERLQLRRAVYIASLAYEVALSQALAEELKPSGIRVQVVCLGVVATEFHERQGLDMSNVPRMAPDDVVIASVNGLAKGEIVCAPGVERSELLDIVFAAELAAFAGQSSMLATRYQAG
jgi:short-subunit dehydrogenase